MNALSQVERGFFFRMNRHPQLADGGFELKSKSPQAEWGAVPDFVCTKKREPPLLRLFCPTPADLAVSGRPSKRGLVGWCKVG